MLLYEQGKPYWEVARRYHLNRATSKAIGPTAVRDMERLRNGTTSKAVLKRINGFIGRHRVQPPKGDGPKVA